MAFTKVCMEKRRPFYFGGHPAITPLVWEVAKDYAPVEFKKFIRIYQSSFFIGKTPREVDFFNNIVWTEKQIDISHSVELMRKQMFSENDTDTVVFIGGMNGIVDEYNMVTRIYPQVKVLPMATTGAASKQLYNDLKLTNTDLSDSYSYVSVFKKYL